MSDKYITADKAAEMLETSQYHTEKLVQAGKLVGYRIGEIFYISLQSIKNRIASR